MKSVNDFTFSNQTLIRVQDSKDYISSVDFPNLRIHQFSVLEGVVAVGGRLDIGTLYHAYRLGIFPWPHPGYPNLWFCPDERGVLDFEDLHISRSLQKFRRQHSEYKFTINQNFLEVMSNCSSQARPGQAGTWINEEIKNGYHDFFKEGYVLSVECWDTSSTRESLVAGIYGVYLKGVFSGESMFHHHPNTSKLTLWYLIEFLQHQGLQWIDTQMVTPLIASFGGKYLPRKLYLEKLYRRQREWENQPRLS